MTARDGFDPGITSHSMKAMFVDVDRRSINYNYFQNYFEQLALPRALAEDCLRDVFDDDTRQPTPAEYVTQALPGGGALTGSDPGSTRDSC